MSSRDAVTPEMMAALARIAVVCAGAFVLTPVSNAVTGRLAKLGWVEIRDAKIYGGPRAGERLRRCRITRAGQAALAAANASLEPDGEPR